MKLVFAGTTPFAAAALAALRRAGHDVALVLTPPDRPAGRGLKLTPSAVAREAARLALRLEKPIKLNEATIHAKLREVSADIMVVAAYGLLLPKVVLDIPRLGCLNIHGSLLPRWRGAAPVQRAIEAGDTETGITIIQMDTGLDTGAVLLEKRIPILAVETSASLFEKLTSLGASTIVDVLGLLPTLVARQQSPEGVTYARKIDKSEAYIDWSKPAALIERRIRAFDPFPGCETPLAGEHVKIWRARVVKGDSYAAAPGIVTNADRHTLTVQCGQDQLQWITVQKPGGKRIAVDDFLRRTTVARGTRLS